MFLCLILTCAAPPEIPAVVRASPHFCGAIGGANMNVVATVSNTGPALGESIEYAITIGPVRNVAEVTAPKLELATFQIESVEAKRSENAASFLYRLRPRAAGPAEIPSLQVDYFIPEAAEGKQLRTKYTDAIAIAVTGPATPAPPIEVPERFRTLAEDREPRSIPLVMWIVVPLLSILAAAAWILHWRVQNPTGARLAKLTRIRAVRRALNRLSREEPGLVFRDYLTERFAVPHHAGTSELIHAARSRIGPRTLQDVESFLHDCDRNRFSELKVMDDADRVRELILALETPA